jgi:hypothetical protein
MSVLVAGHVWSQLRIKFWMTHQQYKAVADLTNNIGLKVTLVKRSDADHFALVVQRTSPPGHMYNLTAGWVNGQWLALNEATGDNGNLEDQVRQYIHRPAAHVVLEQPAIAGSFLMPADPDDPHKFVVTLVLYPRGLDNPPPPAPQQ